MALGISSVIDNLVGGVVGSLSYDDVEITANNLVVIGCNRRSPQQVVGYLAEPITLSSKPEYDHWLKDKLGSVMSLLGTASMVAAQTSIQQPWFNRPMWANTPPLSFSVVVQFIAVDNAEEDVYRPCEALIGYTFPRRSASSSGRTYIQNYHPPGPNLFTGYDGDGKISGNSDYCSLDVGNMISLDICAITNVSVVFSQTLDPNGFPLSARATVTVQASDVGVADQNGVYKLTQKSGPSLGVDSILQVGGELVGTVVDTVGEIGKDVVSLVTGGFESAITAFKEKF